MLLIRPMQAADRRFVEASFFESFMKTLRLSELPFEVYKEGMNARIRRLLDESTTLIAVLEVEPDEILGYSIIDKTARVLHYVYVKAPYRRQGIATKLVAPAKKTYTHLPTSDGKRFFHALGMEPNLMLGEPPHLRREGKTR